jgi:oligopeptide transport system permease protein
MSTGSGRFFRNRAAFASLIFLGLVAILAILAPWVTSFPYEEQNIAARLQGPDFTHWMGTDSLGRDLFSRILFGARMSLAVGLFTALFALVLGTFVGAVSGYFGGWIDAITMRVVEAFTTFPSLLLATLLMLMLGRGFSGILFAIGITAWMGQARLVRGQVLQAREMPYVESARAMGLSPLAVIFKHILPNLWGPIIIALTLQIPANIMAESSLSFIGLGLQPPFSSWGTLANEGFRAIRSYPHLITFPGGILFLTLLSFSYLGDGLRDQLDPKSREGSYG